MSRLPQQPTTTRTTSNSPIHDEGMSSWRPRSDPIAIVRSSEEPSGQQPVVLDSSDDDDYDEIVDNDNDAAVARVNVEMDALKLRSQGLLVGSLPVLTTSRSWRVDYQPPPAPLLRSIPASQGRRSDLVPPIALTSGETKVVQSYGSLRESQMNGRFLDGPSSYRDVRSGRLVAPQGKGIADRLVIVPTTNHINTTKRPSSSTLSAILQNDPSPSQSPSINSSNAYLESLRHNDLHASSIQQQNDHTPTSQRFDSTDGTSMLSTSLTGLEILQSTRMQQLSLEPLQLSQQVQGDGEVHSASFHSRSLSFPTGSLLPPASTATPTGFYRSSSFEPSTNEQHQQQQQQQVHEQMLIQNEENDRNNPDTEGTFELDFDE